MKQFDCILEKMASYGPKNNHDELTCDCDNIVVVWQKRIKAGGINLALKLLSKQHPKMKLHEHYDKLNPNAIRCYVDNESNYHEDVRGFDLNAYGKDQRVIVGMVTVEIREVKIDEDENETHNYGYEHEDDWY